MKIFLTIIFLAVCVGLTVIVLMQEGKAAGLGSIGGIGDSYWGKNKSRSMEGNLVRFTKFLAAAFLILALALNMIPDSSSSSSNVQPVAVETESTTENSGAQTEVFYKKQLTRVLHCDRIRVVDEIVNKLLWLSR